MLKNLNPKEFQDNLISHRHTLIDVREKWELDICKIEGAVNMPVSSIMETFSELNPESSYSLYCHHGMRSMQVAKFLLSNGFKSLFNLQGGIDAWSREIDASVDRY